MWNTPTKEQLDKIPRLYETQDTPLMDKLIYQHFFIFGSDWYVSEYDGNNTFFGFVILNGDCINAEWGYISFQELRKLNISGFEIDCDLYWKPVRAGEVETIKKCINSGCINEQQEECNNEK